MDLTAVAGSPERRRPLPRAACLAYLEGARGGDMRVNSDEAIRRGMLVHRRYGSWNAVRAAIAERERTSLYSQAAEPQMSEPRSSAQRRG